MRLYLRYFAIHLKCQMQYKTSFFLTALGQFLTSFTAFLSVYFLFDRFHQVEGFAFEEVLLCFSVVLFAFSLAECFARGFDTFPSMIGNGEFDRILVRPRSLVFQVLASKMEFSRFGRLLQAVLMLAFALPRCDVEWTAARIGVLLLMVVCGMALFAGLFVVYASLSFFTLEGLEFMNIFTDGAREFGQYPFSIYGKRVLGFLPPVCFRPCAIAVVPAPVLPSLACRRASVPVHRVVGARRTVDCGNGGRAFGLSMLNWMGPRPRGIANGSVPQCEGIPWAHPPGFSSAAASTRGRSQKNAHARKTGGSAGAITVRSNTPLAPYVAVVPCGSLFNDRGRWVKRMARGLAMTGPSSTKRGIDKGEVTG